MADLDDKNSALNVKITGAGTTGLETNFINSSTNNALQVNLRNDGGTEIGTSSTPVRVVPTGTTTQPISAASLPLPTGASTAANQASELTLIGPVTETAPASDTASSGLNGRLQRIAQRITSLIALLPASLGQKTMANSLAVAIASDQSTIPASIGSPDKTTFTYGTTGQQTVGGVYQDTSPTLTAGQEGALRVTQNRAVHSNLRTSSGSELATSLFNGISSLQTTYADSQSIDAVGRLRASDVINIGAYCFYSGIRDLDFNSSITGSGTVTFSPLTASTRLTTTTSSSDSVIRQSKRYFSYAPGIGHAYGLALTVGAQKTNVTQKWGHFDANDGTFFQQTGAAGLSIVIRTSTSGSPVDTTVLQTNWNLDKLDGTGASGITLNTALHNKYVIDMSWYGAGRVRFGIFYRGQVVYCHQFDGANISTLAYTRTPKLPLRVELNNTGTTASTTTLDMVCLGVTQESSAPRIPTYNFSKSIGRVGTVVNSTLIPILSIQPLTTFNGITNRSSIFPKSIQGLTVQQPVLVQLLLNPTLTGSSFASVNTQSCAQYDTTATAVSGGTVIAEFYIPAANENTYDLTDFSETITLSTNIAGSAGDILTLAAVSTAGNTTTWVTIQWHEAQ